MAKRQTITYEGEAFRSLRALAKHLGVDHKTLARRVDQGLPEKEWGKQAPKPPEYTKDQLQDLLDQRLSYPVIAERLGTTAAGIEHRVARWKLKRPPALSEVLTKEILLDGMERGLSQVELASEHGFVSQSPVIDACSRHDLEWNPVAIFKPRTAGANLQSVDYQGVHYVSIAELARQLELPRDTLAARIDGGWPMARWAEPLKDLDVDITGRRFGRLVALRLTQRASREKGTGQRWLFQCDCGATHEADKSLVTHGSTQSCGCLRKETAGKARQKLGLEGQVFADGNLKVLRQGPTIEHLVTWICHCKLCGKESKPIPGKKLRSGVQKSCGCLQGTRGDLVDRVFGRLKVLSLAVANPGAGGRRLWECECSCAKKTKVQVPTALLVNGNTRSCGCLKSETAVQNFKNEGFEAYRLDPAYAERESYIYFVEVVGEFEKIGIAFDIERRGRGDYSEIWWSRSMTRAECWAVEQVALHCTRGYAMRDERDDVICQGSSEFREGIPIDETINLLNNLADECKQLGWQHLYERYLGSIVYEAG